MKKYALLIPLLISMCAAVGCGEIPSLNPLTLTENDTFDPALIGVWRGTELSAYQVTYCRTEFVQGNDAYDYKITYTQDEASASFNAELVQIEDCRFLDIFPIVNTQEEEVSEADCHYFFGSLIPVHFFFLVEQVEPELIVRSFDPSWLEEYLTSNPDALRHAFYRTEYGEEPWRGEGLLLTASSEELQAFINEHLDTEGAITVAFVYHRVNEN